MFFFRQRFPKSTFRGPELSKGLKKLIHRGPGSASNMLPLLICSQDKEVPITDSAGMSWPQLEAPFRGSRQNR